MDGQEAGTTYCQWRGTGGNAMEQGQWQAANTYGNGERRQFGDFLSSMTELAARALGAWWAVASKAGLEGCTSVAKVVGVELRMRTHIPEAEWLALDDAATWTTQGGRR